jgi:hypothetical protein
VRPSRGLVAMIPIMLSVGLFDMGLRVVVAIFCTSKAHPLGESLSSSRWSRCATSGFFSRSPTLLELFAASHLVVECLKLLAPLLWRLKPARVDFSVELFGPPTWPIRRGLACVFGKLLRGLQALQASARPTNLQASQVQYPCPCNHRLRPSGP